MTEKKPNKKIEEIKEEIVSKPNEEKTEVKLDEKTEAFKKIDEEKKNEPVKEVKIDEKPKKRFSVVNAYDLPISTKHSIAVCKFVKKKKIEDAIKDIEAVLKFKKAVPMKGEIPHRKGENMMSGRFVTKTAQAFLKLLKNLSANANANGIENPVVVEAIANIGQRPYGKFGSVRKKRTHVKITAKNMEKK